MTRNRVRDEYFRWLIDRVGETEKPRGASYRALLAFLNIIPFRYSLPMDENRANDGLDLRYQFARSRDYICPIDETLDRLSDPCSVLEMMVALAMRCEETMDDTAIGDRTAQWFWGMIRNLGLGSMYDARFDEEYVEDVIDDFLDRNYAPDGRGGLFTIKNCDRDLRNVEIWHQLWWYLDSIM